VTPQGYKISCTDLTKPHPYGVNLKVTGFDEDDLESIDEHMKSYSFNKTMDPMYVASANMTCNKDLSCPNYVCLGKMICPEVPVDPPMNSTMTDSMPRCVYPMPVENAKMKAIKQHFSAAQSFSDSEKKPAHEGDIDIGWPCEPMCYCDAEYECQGMCPTDVYADKTLRVVSYNTHLPQGEEVTKLVIDDAASDSRTFEMAYTLSEFDVVGLQEIYAPKDNGRKFGFI